MLAISYLNHLFLYVKINSNLKTLSILNYSLINEEKLNAKINKS